MNYLTEISTVLGIPIWLLLIIVVWSAVWKLLALWKSARKKHVAWFIILAIINTVGILEILYIYIFSEIKFNKKPEENIKKKVKKRR